MSTSISEPRAAADSSAPREATTGVRLFYVRYFFVAMAGLFLVITAVGFGPSYGSVVSGTSHPSWFIHVHGAIMLGWLFLFLVQTVLAAAGHLNFHRQLGLSSIVIGGLVFVSMGVISFRRIVLEHPPVEDLGFDMLALELYIMAIFGWFFSWGIMARKDAAVHKRLFLVTMIPVVHPAIGRIAWLPALGIVFPHAWYVHVDTLLIPLFIYDWATQGSIHKITWIGSGSIVVAQLLVLAAWGSPVWHHFWFGLFGS